MERIAETAEFAALTEVTVDAGVRRLDAAQALRQMAAAEAKLRALEIGDAELVACFETSCEGLAFARAGLTLDLTVVPWQHCAERGDWKEIRRRCLSFGGRATKPVLVTTERLLAQFQTEDLAAFARVEVVALPGNGADPQHTGFGGGGKLRFETAGTTRNPRMVEMPAGGLLARVPASGGVRLECEGFDTATGVERIAPGGPARLILNAGLAAADPAMLLRTAAAHLATELCITPGLIARLLREFPDDVRLPSLRLLAVGGARVPMEDVRSLAKRLLAAGALHLAVKLEYRTAESGLVAATDPLPAAAFPGALAQGAYLCVGHPPTGGQVRIVDNAFQPLASNEIGQVQMLRTAGIASAYIERNGSETPVSHPTGWTDTGDLGFLNEAGLTLTSRRNAQIVVPRKVVQFADLERRLRSIDGLRQEMLAVLTVKRESKEMPALAVCFSSVENTREAVAAIAGEIFSQIVALTGVQPEVYHCRANIFPLTPGLAVRRDQLRRMIVNGTLVASAEPRMTVDGADMLSLAELQAQVAVIWQSVLLTEAPPKAQDDFFALGGDSLNLTTMLTEVENLFRQSVDIEVFFNDPTIAGLCRSLQDAANRAPVLEPAQSDGGGHVRKIGEFTAVWRGEKAFPDSVLRGSNTDGSRPPLFWVLQSEQSFRVLAERLGPDQPFYAMRSAVGIIEHYGQDSLEEIANRYLWELLGLARGRDFYLGGNCQGAIIALALARRLQQIDQPPERLIMMEWFFEFGGYTGPTTFLTGEDSFVAELQQTVPSLQKLQELFPASDARTIAGSHGQFFTERYVGGVADGIAGALVPAHFASARASIN
ncbi:phosphopantetheine-binding protein [Algicella marina]|uniref:AMP-binding protein n=1 Tax=Algicella marina TaxID=2683284 RepID=A0A6P1T2V4_9RHOB|nr:phosphopantetheine-binding protein [Algicella marina]QHQ36061.1 AMP-binding protein [Algicella marina]